MYNGGFHQLGGIDSRRRLHAEIVLTLVLVAKLVVQILLLLLLLLL